MNHSGRSRAVVTTVIARRVHIYNIYAVFYKLWLRPDDLGRSARVLGALEPSSAPRCERGVALWLHALSE